MRGRAPAAGGEAAGEAAAARVALEAQEQRTREVQEELLCLEQKHRAAAAHVQELTFKARDLARARAISRELPAHSHRSTTSSATSRPPRSRP